jgi:hypothetical protein
MARETWHASSCIFEACCVLRLSLHLPGFRVHGGPGHRPHRCEERASAFSGIQNRRCTLLGVLQWLVSSFTETHRTLQCSAVQCRPTLARDVPLSGGVMIFNDGSALK